MEIAARNLIEETYNYYGLKASLQLAMDYLEQFGCATPGSFLDWIKNTRQ